MTVQDWLQTNTYHHSEFQDISRLVELKEEQDLTITVSLPTLNEEETIAKELILIRTELMIKNPLVDEIAVVDSGSDDRTREIAEEYGASVFLASEYLEEEGVYQGKGENLWKTLYLLEGDIIVYLDADIKNIDPKFVYGLVGPLLEREELGYVKAFYDRPLEVGTEQRSSGGGRVTEILVRPLLNLFFPKLAGMIQPLSGEYAGRRSVLEQLPFFIGYGVETGLLIDIGERFGIESIAQVDLDRRVHHNQDLQSLSKMAFGILQTFFNRVDELDKIKLKQNLGKVFRTILAADEEFSLQDHDLPEIERPPILQLEQYRQKHNREFDQEPVL
ncbi:MAG: glucosyl-3-phosphoglycerate synthase [bacterium]